MRKEATVPAQLTIHITMADLIAGWPAAGPLLVRRGMACVGCAMARFETVGEAAAAYGFDPEPLLQDVRRTNDARQRTVQRRSSR